MKNNFPTSELHKLLNAVNAFAIKAKSGEFLSLRLNHGTYSCRKEEGIIYVGTFWFLTLTPELLVEEKPSIAQYSTINHRLKNICEC